MSLYVDDLLDYGAAVPWRGGRSCHLWSDESEEELVRFAVVELRMRRDWLQRGSVTHFDLAPSLRARAIRRGAIAVSTRDPEWRAAIQRARSRGLTNAGHLQTSAGPRAVLVHKGAAVGSSCEPLEMVEIEDLDDGETGGS